METTNKKNAAFENFVPVEVEIRGKIGTPWNGKAIMGLPTVKANGSEVIFAKTQKEMASLIGATQATISYCINRSRENLCKGYKLVSIDNNIDGALNAIALHHQETMKDVANREAARTARIAELESKAAQWDAYQAQLAAEAEAKRQAEEARQRAIEARNKKIAELEQRVKARKQLVAQYAAKLASAQESVSEAENELTALREQEV